MPPEKNTNANNVNLNNVKIGIDPVFKGNTSSQKNDSLVQNSQNGAYELLKNQQYTPSQVPKPILTPEEIEKAKNTSPKSIVRTYKGDLATAIAADHLSSINIAIAENQKMNSQIRAEQQVEEPEQTGNYSKGKIIFFISLLLIIAGIVGIGFVFFMKSQNSTPTVQVQELPSLFTTEYKNELNTDSMSSAKFAIALSSKFFDFNIPVNNFYNAYITIGTTTTRRLINSGELNNLLNLKMPDLIRRTLLPDYMVGMYSFGKNIPFIVFKTSYFENAYAGMLQWEVDMESDLRTIFRLPGYNNNAGILGSLTPMAEATFMDSVITNKDVRVLKDSSGEIRLLYGIIDKETIVITTSDVAFKEIINRLIKEKSLKR